MSDIVSRPPTPGTVPPPKIASRKRPPAPCRAKDPDTCPYHGRLMPPASETVRDKMGAWGAMLSDFQINLLQREYVEERKHLTRLSFDGLDEAREIRLSEGVDEGVAALELLHLVESNLTLMSSKKSQKEHYMHRLEGTREEDMTQFDQEMVRSYLKYHILESELTGAQTRLNGILDKEVTKRFNRKAKQDKRSNFLLEITERVGKALEDPFL